MNSTKASILKPINRMTYFLTRHVLFFVVFFALAFVFIKMSPDGQVGTSSINTLIQEIQNTYIIMMLNPIMYLIFIFLDYKRIIDISDNKNYLILLIVPILFFLFALLNIIDPSIRTEIQGLAPDKISSLILSVGVSLVFGLVKTVYGFFLLFKKGKNA